MDFKEYRLLQEVFDYPYKTEKIEYDKDAVAAMEKKHGISDYSDHKILDDSNRPNSFLTVLKRNGAYEIHHSLDDDVSGEMVPNTTGSPNPRFISTVLKFAKEKIDDGHAVRIVGDNVKKYGTSNTTMFEKYHQFGRIFAKKFGLKISEPVPHTKSNPHANSGTLKEFEISKE